VLRNKLSVKFEVYSPNWRSSSGFVQARLAKLGYEVRSIGEKHGFKIPRIPDDASPLPGGSADE